MALWGKTDATGSVPKFLSAADAANAFFVDATEAEQPENIAKGINGPGWWLYTTYNLAGGGVRHKAECLVPIYATAADAGDQADDAVLVDRTLAITTQPANQSVVEPAAATFSVVATVSPTTTITYQWQKAESSAPTVWGNLVGATSASYTTDATAVAAGAGATNGDLYRVIVSSSGATSITSAAATLTVTA